MNNLKIVHQNIQGLRNKLDLIEIFIELESPDVLCFTERFLKLNEICTLKLNGFILASSYCREICKNGGSCIFVKENIQFEVLNVTQFCLEKHCEIAALKINLNPELIVIVVYRTPLGSFNLFLDSIKNFDQ